MRATNLCAAFAAAAVITAFGQGAFAADLSRMGDTGTSMGTSVIDYTALINPSFDYVDLRQASDAGLSNNEIAAVAKIAERTSMPFRDVAAAVERGETFATLADRANMSLPDLWNVTDERGKIANYIQAYESTGTGSTIIKVKGARIARYMVNGREVMTDKDIIDLASGNENLTMFVNAVRTAGLVDTLKGPGPFTIFAPTDAAFAALPSGTLDAWLNDKAALRNVLLYHVLPGRVDSGMAMAMITPATSPTIQGGTLQVTSPNGILKVNGATVIVPNLIATNGIIHIVDTVLTPPSILPPATIVPTLPPAAP